MTKGLSYEEFQEIGRSNYNKGGDVIVECWSEQDFNNYVKEFGEITKSRANRMMRNWKSEEDEHRAMMNW